MKIDFCQADAEPKRLAADVGDAVIYREFGQARTGKERTVPEADDTVGERDAAQAKARDDHPTARQIPVALSPNACDDGAWKTHSMMPVE
ncbi:MAG: hypothetical protein WCQ21_20340 [Verrucomicrobiota bacterium]